MNPKLSSDRAAMVEPSQHWIRIEEETAPNPGSKVLLINEHYGVAIVSTWRPSDTYWTHWYPLPTFKKDTQ